VPRARCRTGFSFSCCSVQLGRQFAALFRPQWPVSRSAHAHSLLRAISRGPSRARPRGLTSALEHMEGPAAASLKGATQSSIPQCGYPIALLKRRLLFQNSVLGALSLPAKHLSLVAFPSQHGCTPFPTHRSPRPSSTNSTACPHPLHSSFFPQ
jgi:hypothetical protein